MTAKLPQKSRNWKFWHLNEG